MERGTALVTGASSGIGAAACRRLRTDGWHVVGLARRSSPDADASIRADVADLGQVQEAVGALGELRLLVHAAAVIGPVSGLVDGDPDAWRENVAINLLGTYNILRTVLAGPLAGDGGIAIHLTTGAAANPKPHWSAYSASKAAAEQLMRCAAIEIETEGRAMAVCALDPGVTETPMQEQIRAVEFPGVERFRRAHAERTSNTAQDVAAAVAELARREPSALNGRTFRVGEL